MLSLLVLIALIYFGRKLDWAEVWRAVERTHKGLLALGALLISLTYITRAFRWQVLLAPLAKASLSDLFAATCVGFGAIFVVGRAGEIARPVYLSLRNREVKTSAAFVTIAVERLFDMVTTILLFAVSLVFLRGGGETDAASFARVRQAGFVLLAGAVVVVIALLIFNFRAERVLSAVEHRLGLNSNASQRTFTQRFGAGAINILRQLDASLSVLTDARSLIVVIVWTAVTWGLIVAANVCVMRAFDLPLNPLQIIFVLGCALVGSLVPTPGGAAGAFEGATMGGLYLLGIGRETGLAVAIVLKFVSFAPAVLFAAYFLLTGGVKLRNLRATSSDDGNQKQVEPI